VGGPAVRVAYQRVSGQNLPQLGFRAVGWPRIAAFPSSAPGRTRFPACSD